MDFAKLQGLGNDFVLLDARRIWPENVADLARRICDRHFGIGGDGLLILAESERADFRMHMFNPDGSEAEACGNGLRCLVRYIVYAGLSKADKFKIETQAGIRVAELVVKKELPQIKVSMGRPQFDAAVIPVETGSWQGSKEDIMIAKFPLCLNTGELQLNFVSMGNPHAVMFIQEPVASYPLAEIGPAVEKHPIFPRGVNFEVARILDGRTIEMRVWERGAGETLACGSGAAALAVAARILGYTTGAVDIILPGGVAGVEWNGKDQVWLTGPAEPVFTGKWLS